VSLVNQIIVGHSEIRGELVPKKFDVNKHVCYAAQFHGVNTNGKSDVYGRQFRQVAASIWYNAHRPYTWTAYRLSHPEKQTKISDWFLKEVLIPAIPDRVRPHVTFVPMTAKNQEDYLDALPAGTGNDYGAHPWMLMFLDDIQLYPEDAYVLFSQFRLPQEDFELVQEAYDIYTAGDIKCSPEEAYMLAAWSHKEYLGHLMIANTSLATNWKRGLEKCTFTNLWKNTKLSPNLWVAGGGLKITNVATTWMQINVMAPAEPKKKSPGNEDEDYDGFGDSWKKFDKDNFAAALAILRKAA
jgi:hypothetical protein